MIEHVWERSRQSRYLSRVVIATDSREIASAARGFGAEAMMTRGDHPSGTDRVAEVAASTDTQIIVNIQGDEPLIDPAAIDAAILALLDDPGCEMATLKKRILDPRDIGNPNVVKVVTASNGDALYFSRSPIPHNRSGDAVSLEAYRAVCLSPNSAARLLAPAAGPAGGGREARAIESPGERHPDSRG